MSGRYLARNGPATLAAQRATILRRIAKIDRLIRSVDVRNPDHASAHAAIDAAFEARPMRLDLSTFSNFVGARYRRGLR